MSTHDAEYFRQRHRDQGIPARDPFSAPRFQQRATELQGLEQLPWPRNLSGEPTSIAELMAGSVHAGENADGACPRGCRKEHKQNVSRCRGTPTVAASMLSTSARKPARAGGTGSGGSDRSATSEPVGPSA
jgi:hypothetical protein